MLAFGLRRFGLTLGLARASMHGVAPQMCCRGASPLLGRGAGGRSPGFFMERLWSVGVRLADYKSWWSRLSRGLPALSVASPRIALLRVQDDRHCPVHLARLSVRLSRSRDSPSRSRMSLQEAHRDRTRLLRLASRVGGRRGLRPDSEPPARRVLVAWQQFAQT